MRILHTSDWHLGKSIHGQDLTEDQAYALKGLLSELRGDYDGVIIAGDIYDRAVPSSDAVHLFSSFIEQIVELGITAVIIPGNHDSFVRLDYASGVLERSGIHFRCGYERISEPVSMNDGDGNLVHVYALPFVDEVHVRAQFPEEGIRTHQEATGFLLDRIRAGMDPNVPAMLAAHAYTGPKALRSDSERELLVGQQGLVDIDVFTGFDYVAMGHLHRPQISSSRSNIRYSGSLIPYSFSEADHEKSSVRIELSNGQFRAEAVPHHLMRRFSCIEGTMKDLLESGRYEGFRDRYLSVTITDLGMLIDIRRRLSERFPYILEIDQPALHIEETGTRSISRKDADNPSRLFSLFLDRFDWEEGEDRDRACEIFEDVRRGISRREAGS